MYGYVYLTTNLIDGKKYIGMHKWTKDSIDPNYFGSGILLRKAIEKYGKENFICEIIEWCETREELSEREKFWVSYYKAPIDEQYYNIEDGGLGGHSEYYKQPLTENQLKSLEYGRHLPASPLLKQTLSQIRKNIQVSEETREKLRKANLGKKQSEATRAKRSKALKGNHNNKLYLPEVREKLREASSNRVHIHKGTQNKNIKKELLDEYLADNWELGYYYKTKKFND